MLVIHLNDRLVTGGVATIIILLNNAAKRAGIESRIFLAEKKGSIEKIDGLIGSFWCLTGMRKWITLASSIFPIKLILLILKYKISNKDPIIHLHTPYLPVAASAIIASLISNTPLVYSVHANLAHIPKFYRFIETFIIKFSSKTILELKASRADYPKLAKSPDTSWIPFGVDKLSISRKWTPSKNKNFTFIAANRLDANRMTSIFIEAFALQHNDDSVMIIVGDGPELISLSNQVLELDVKDFVKFHSSVKENELQHYFNDADCLITLSTFGDVGMTGKIAAGIGMPLLAYEFHGSSQEAYTAHTINELSNKMINIKNNTFDDLIVYGAYINSKLSFDSERMIEKHLSIYKNLLQ